MTPPASMITSTEYIIFSNVSEKIIKFIKPMDLAKLRLNERRKSKAKADKKTGA
ncbi:hypothetical protein [Denitrobaculum tricleocarpae]|uniref:hypothetical protein n=1 Tax=Denitrobaculum tricleocarpae TaxID=2591009 RepID=UPI0015D4327B|nr:hypothetical protein [Denitrobaculum tricleocarpae]